MSIEARRAIAPGKIIISGEHAVVYGAPALAVAVAVYAGVDARIISASELVIHLTDLDQQIRCPLDQLSSFKCVIDERYAQFEKGKRTINGANGVLSHHWELYQYAVAYFFEQHALSDIGLEISLNSAIPMRSGMGSSAATLAAVLVAVAACFDVTLERATLFSYAQTIERLAHGCMSTIDPMVTVYGGLVKVLRSQLESRSSIPEVNWYLVNTGEPSVGTGECVAWVRKHFATSSIWNEFTTIGKEIESAFRGCDTRALRVHLNTNHELLVALGVVPAPVQHFIRELRQSYPAAAKISGAGAVAGDNAGFVLVQSDEPIDHLCQRYGYHVSRLSSDMSGARLRA